MKISEPRPGVVTPKPRLGQAKAGDAATKGGVMDVAPPPVALSIMGIPEAELTPKVRSAIMHLMEEVDSMRRELNMAQRRLVQLERLADQDALAPVANRRAFVRELSRHLSFAERYNQPASLIYFDVNGFKAINDKFGHSAGDAALMHVARVLADNIRESDVVGRLGGDEFGVILVQSDLKSSNEKAERLASLVRTVPFVWEGETLPLNTAYGVYPFKGGEDAGAALARADEAMYAHKKSMREAGPSQD
ncbi:GGDEF domain-containing protein [Zavarzinia sp. CC-PAN008]|uniref:GGDEF domain-containing protein n=1 Tax=Zavarzinia sp. CC-PAN008 TaxID=3243332 RepID=UPI003F7451C7